MIVEWMMALSMLYYRGTTFEHLVCLLCHKLPTHQASARSHPIYPAVSHMKAWTFPVSMLFLLPTRCPSLLRRWTVQRKNAHIQATRSGCGTLQSLDYRIPEKIHEALGSGVCKALCLYGYRGMAKTAFFGVCLKSPDKHSPKLCIHKTGK